MNLTQLLERYDKFVAEQREVLIKKNSDYAKEGDVFHNFKTSALTTGITPAQGCLNQLCIKTTRLGSLMAPGKEVQNEPVLDSSEDAFVYAFLLHEIILEGQGVKNQIPRKESYIQTVWGFEVRWPEGIQIQAVDSVVESEIVSGLLVDRENSSVWYKEGNSASLLGILVIK
jgi:hypothetical protein